MQSQIGWCWFESARHSGPDILCAQCSQPACMPPWSVLAVIWLVALCKRLPPCPPPDGEKNPASIFYILSCECLWFSQLENSSCCQPASGGLHGSSTAEQRAELRAFPLSASSGPTHLLSCWVGPCRRSPLSFKIKHAELLACQFPSLHSWSFTFASKVTFSTFFSLSFPATTPRVKIFFFLFLPLLPFLTLLAFSGLLQALGCSGFVCVIVGGWSTSVGSQRSECWKTVHKQQPRKSKGKVEC